MWGMILAGMAVAGLAALAVRMSRALRPAPPMPEPALRTLADWRRVRESALDPRERRDWIVCACCGAPTYDPHGGCGLCGWAEGEPLERARENFALFGTIDTPEEMAQWGELPPTDEERAVVRQVVELCARAAPGQEPGAEFWSGFDALAHALGELRDQRLADAQQAARAAADGGPG
jgi:hypothetical protein